MKPMYFRERSVHLWRYMHIIYFKTYANLKAEHAKTYLGCFWWVLEPLINTAVYYLIFTLVIKNRGSTLSSIFIGTIVFGWFQNGVNQVANSIIQHSGLVQQVYLPKLLFPFIVVSNLTWKFLFSLLLLLPILWFAGYTPSFSYLALPFLLFIQFFLIVAIGLPLAALMPYFPDGRTVVATLLALLMWCSGIFYSVSQVPDDYHLKDLFFFNPAAGFIEAYRNVLLDGQFPLLSHFVPGLLTGCLFGGVGLVLIWFVDRRVAKIAM